MLHVVVPYSRQNASVRTRALHWIERRARATGVTVDEIATVHGPDALRGRPPTGAPLLLVRNAHRFSRGHREARLLSSAAPGVYDLDDGLPWDDGRLPDLGRWWKRPWPRSLIADRAARSADRVVVGNEVLAEWAATRCRDVRIIPTCVEPAEYTAKLDYAVHGPPTLGWIGSPATEHYLVGIAPALAEVHRRTGARLHLVSAAGTVPDALQPFTTRIVWDEATVGRLPATWDVGLMPLHDGVYERAKCGYKLLQYAAAGLPSVASPVGVNARLLAEMQGLAATTVDDWVDALLMLLDEPAAAREARGDAGRATALRTSYDVWEPAWSDAVGLPPLPFVPPGEGWR